VPLEHLWAGWRLAYIDDESKQRHAHGDCVICDLDAADDDAEALVLERSALTITVMNLYPYTSGHVMVSPRRHVGSLGELSDDEADALMRALRRASAAIDAAYAPGGQNVGLNQGAAAGAGLPGHLHVHALPRWAGDTNFMTSVAEARVLPEDIRTSYERLRAALGG
jgi:diadenosine tetraphosphate (Ap4A) HIT family hydrolase